MNKSVIVKIKDLQNQYNELNNDIEDLYNTINDFKYKHNNNLDETDQDQQHELEIDNHCKLECIKQLIPKCTNEQMLEYIKYYDTLSLDEQSSILDKSNNLLIDTKTLKPDIFRILESPLSNYHKKLALSKLNILQTMGPEDTEYYKLTQWINNLLDIPFNTFITPKYLEQSPDILFTNARKQLDKILYGQSTTKQHILEIVAKMISNPSTNGTVFAVEGEAGTGKTTLIKDGLSQVLGLPFIFISLGGAHDSTYLTGDNYTYIGSKSGRIIQALKEAKCMNPIFYFDELDKVSNTERGQEIINLLIHLTDFSQNGQFLDQYMDGITVDLSKAIFIFSFNDRSKICPILLDRMKIIKFHSYSEEQKKYILEHHLLPKIINQYFGNRKIEIKYDNKQNIINRIINTSPTKKMLNINHIMQRHRKCNIKSKQKIGGVRYISHRLEQIIARININILEHTHSKQLPKSITLDNNLINTIL